MKNLLIDDFSAEISAIGTTWEGFTDQVMGGKSEMRVGRIVEAGPAMLSMSGTVSLANNGGFIQSRIMLNPRRGAFDASGYSGIKIIARGRGTGYYIFLRTTANVFPWSFFIASLPVTEEWTEILIPWSQFEKGDFGAFFALDLKKLSSLAVVAYKKEFTAKLDVRMISLY